MGNDIRDSTDKEWNGYILFLVLWFSALVIIPDQLNQLNIYLHFHKKQPRPCLATFRLTEHSTLHSRN